jgi:signal peptidase II
MIIMKQHRAQLLAAIALMVVVLDQILKIWVKTTFYLGEDVALTSWFHIAFVQNPGMAFGWEMGSKLALTLFRIVAIGVGVWYLCRLLRRNTQKPFGYLVCVALIVAGAAGNVIDCMFYGLIFDNPMPPQTAALFPAAGGYGTFLHGQVVDMLYFPLFSFTWPDWMPWVGGEYFEFFHPVFNLADSAITVGILALILFYSKQLNDDEQDANSSKA